MSNTTVSTSVANPIRTGVQGGLAWGVTEFLDAFEIIAMDERQYGVTLVLLTIAFSALQNVGENFLGKGFLRNVPEPEQKVIDG
jgi:hypothetical protein